MVDEKDTIQSEEEAKADKELEENPPTQSDLMKLCHDSLLEELNSLQQEVKSPPMICQALFDVFLWYSAQLGLRKNTLVQKVKEAYPNLKRKADARRVLTHAKNDAHIQPGVSGR